MKKALLTGIAVLFLATGAAHADTPLPKPRPVIDTCLGEDKGYCYNENGKICFKEGDCCKIRHDWNTEYRDGGVCKRKPRRK